jgi:hypothetical protein
MQQEEEEYLNSKSCFWVIVVITTNTKTPKHQSLQATFLFPVCLCYFLVIASSDAAAMQRYRQHQILHNRVIFVVVFLLVVGALATVGRPPLQK